MHLSLTNPLNFVLSAALLLGTRAALPPMFTECDCPTLDGPGTQDVGGTWVWVPTVRAPGECDTTCEQDGSGCYWQGILEWHRPPGATGMPWMGITLIGDDPTESDERAHPGDITTGVVMTKVKKTIDCGAPSYLVQAWLQGNDNLKDDFWFECGDCSLPN